LYVLHLNNASFEEIAHAAAATERVLGRSSMGAGRGGGQQGPSQRFFRDREAYARERERLPAENLNGSGSMVAHEMSAPNVPTRGAAGASAEQRRSPSRGAYAPVFARDDRYVYEHERERHNNFRYTYQGFCDFCGKQGHSAERCFARQRAERREDRGQARNDGPWSSSMPAARSWSPRPRERDGAMQSPLSGANNIPLGGQRFTPPALGARGGGEREHDTRGAAAANTYTDVRGDRSVSSCDAAPTTLAPMASHFAAQVLVTAYAEDATATSTSSAARAPQLQTSRQTEKCARIVRATGCIDSGCAISLVDSSWLKANFPTEYEAASKLYELSKKLGLAALSAAPVLRTATGAEVPVEGDVVLRVAYAGTARADVAQGPPDDNTAAPALARGRLVRFTVATLSAAFNLIIGMDELGAAGAIIDTGRRTVSIAADTQEQAGGSVRADSDSYRYKLERSNAAVGVSREEAAEEKLPIQPNVAAVELVPPEARAFGRMFDQDKAASAAILGAYSVSKYKPEKRVSFADDGVDTDGRTRRGRGDAEVHAAMHALPDLDLKRAVHDKFAAGEWGSGCALCAADIDELADWLQAEWADVFAPKGKHPGCSALVRHHIEVDPAAKPVHHRPYRVARAEEDDQRKEIQMLLDLGIIRPSTSPWAAPSVRVRKPDGSTRTCIDYRSLNAITKKDRYPMPVINDILPRLHGARVFSCLDLTMGYYQIAMAPSDIEKTAFTTTCGLFEFLYMPFGLCNAPATFQRLMDVCFNELIGVCVYVYLDDVVVFSRDEQQHRQHLARVFNVLRHANLHLNMAKCKLFLASVTFLGHRVDKHGVHTDKEKCAAVAEFPTPTSSDDVRRFLGLAGYYRRFVRNYADISAPLTALLSKRAVFNWGEHQQTAFNKIKERLTATDVLTFPDFDGQPFILTTDASNVGVGAVLSQRQPERGKPQEDARTRTSAQAAGADGVSAAAAAVADGGENDARVLVEYPIAYASRQLSTAEKNYSASERELLAVIFGTQQFRQYLLGRDFVIVTDHQALTHLLHLSQPTGRLARWSMALAEFQFVIKYKAGRAIPHADALSRAPEQAAPNTELLSFNNRGGGDREQVGDWGSGRQTAAVAHAQAADEHVHAHLQPYMIAVATTDADADTEAEAGAEETAGKRSAEAAQQQREQRDVARSTSALPDAATFAREQRADPEWKPIIDYIVSGELPNGLDDKQARALVAKAAAFIVDSENGALYFAEAAQPAHRQKERMSAVSRRLAVPRTLVQAVLREMHDTALAGHLGVSRTFDGVYRRFMWPRQFDDVKSWVRSCVKCAESKSPTQKQAGKLQHVVPASPWDIVAIDVVGPLPTTAGGRGARYIIVVGDLLTKWIEAVPVQRADAATTARVLVENIICRHGAPRQLLSDRGTNFLAHLIVEINAFFRVRKLTTSAYHPQTDGFVERFNKTLGTMLRAFVDEHQDDWDVCLPALLFAYRRSTQASTGDTPFALMYGRDPPAPIDREWPTAVALAGDGPKGPVAWRNAVFRTTTALLENAKKKLELARAAQADDYNDKHRVVVFDAGDLVMLRVHAAKPGQSLKLTQPWRGPLRVATRVSEQVYTLQRINGTTLTTPVHVQRLKRFVARGDELLDATTSTTPQVDNDGQLRLVTENDDHNDTNDGVDMEPERDSNGVFDEPGVYKVETILAKRGRAGRVQYLVKWAGFTEDDNSWEPAGNILDQQLIDDFNVRQKQLKESQQLGNDVSEEESERAGAANVATPKLRTRRREPP